MVSILFLAFLNPSSFETSFITFIKPVQRLVITVCADVTSFLTFGESVSKAL